MAKDTKSGFLLNGHVIPAAKVVAVLAFVFWLGGQVVAIRTAVENNWTTPDQVVHDLQTEAMNPGHNTPDALKIVQARKKLSKS